MATKQAQSEHMGIYGGTHGNVAIAPFYLAGGAAADDVIELGKAHMGVMIVGIAAGVDVAAAGCTVDVKMIKEDGNAVTLVTGLDVNNKMSEKLILPVLTGFDTGKPEIQAVVKGAAVPAAANLHVHVKYITVGTE